LGKAQDIHSSDSPDAPEDNSETEWAGFDEYHDVKKQDQYLDEGLYTTVTVEAVDVSKEGIHSINEDDDDDGSGSVRVQKKSSSTQSSAEKQLQSTDKSSKKHTRKKKKRFRYETKAERTVQKLKARAKRKAQEGMRRRHDA
jgi:ribosomal RNA-processing protein 17